MGSLFKSSTEFDRFSILLVNSTEICILLVKWKIGIKEMILIVVSL